MFVGFVQGLAGVLEGPTGRLTRPQSPHELETWQRALPVPFRALAIPP
jgi:hypothetical protein